ncbi:MAG: GNAT family N-acetyltransferase [Pirellulales bacterium]|nr:GNAT family N-acetyltransferase [Pirellulales bacterium]
MISVERSPEQTGFPWQISLKRQNSCPLSQFVVSLKEPSRLSDSAFPARGPAMRFMNLQYVKRYRMLLDLKRWQPPPIELPIDYRLVGWHTSLAQAHAEVKYHSFCDELDSQVFPCLGELEGCERLMAEIEAKEGFLPEATWLAEYVGDGPERSEYCGTIQAVETNHGKASIQNIGVVPYHRGRGLGTALILAALLGLQHVGIRRAHLEVTADNEGAVKLYRQLGFRTVRTLYKAVELAYASPAR